MADSASASAKKSGFLPKNKFSRKQLIIFIVIFATLGGFLIWRSFAASVAIATVNAEQMTLPAGATIVAHSTASGGQIVRMTQASSLKGTVNLSSAANSITVNALSQKCRKSFSQVKVLINGQQALSTTVNSTSLKGFNAGVTLSAGTHNIEIANVPVTVKNCTSALSVDNLVFYGESTTPPPPSPTVTLSANPTSVTAGGSSTLNWSSTNATSCTASGGWTGTKATSGSGSVGPLSATTSFNLACTGQGGTANTSTTVTVNTTQVPAAPTVYLSPLTQTYAVGATFTVEVKVDSGTTSVNAVQANLSYPTDKLEYVSVDNTGSAFSTVAETSGVNGRIAIARGTTTPVSGTQLLVKITFRTKAAGTASVPFITGTQLVSSTTNQSILPSLSSTGGGNYTIQ